MATFVLLINIGLTVLVLSILVSSIAAVVFLFVKRFVTFDDTNEDPIRASGNKARRAIDQTTREFLNEVNEQVLKQEERNEPLR